MIFLFQNFQVKIPERSEHVIGFRAVFNTLSNIYDEAFFQAVNFFLQKSSIVDVWPNSEYASEFYNE